jgi:hypothetical protein
MTPQVTAGRVVAAAQPRCAPRADLAEPDRVSPLADVQFVTPLVGWVVGRNRILHTADGGGHWQVQRRARHSGLREIDAVSPSRAWAVGRNVVLATTNGGATWRRVNDTCPTITSVHFFSSRAGVAIGRDEVLRTSDRGKSWHHVAAPRRAQSVCLSGRHRGWLGAHGQIYRTTDGGRRWRLAVAGPRVQGHDVRRGDGFIAQVQCSGRNAGWGELVGTSGAASQEPHIAYRLHGHHGAPVFAEQYFPHPGVRVRRESPGNYFAAFSAIDTADAAFLDSCAVCDYPAPGTNPGTAPFEITGSRHVASRGIVKHVDDSTGLAFVSSSEGWAIGSRAHYRHHRLTHAVWRIEHTVDGGKSWTTQYSH